jgi:hypothetical protein
LKARRAKLILLAIRGTYPHRSKLRLRAEEEPLSGVDAPNASSVTAANEATAARTRAKRGPSRSRVVIACSVGLAK